MVLKPCSLWLIIIYATPGIYSLLCTQRWDPAFQGVWRIQLRVQTWSMAGKTDSCCVYILLKMKNRIGKYVNWFPILEKNQNIPHKHQDFQLIGITLRAGITELTLSCWQQHEQNQRSGQRECVLCSIALTAPYRLSHLPLGLLTLSTWPDPVCMDRM